MAIATARTALPPPPKKRRYPAVIAGTILVLVAVIAIARLVVWMQPHAAPSAPAPSAIEQSIAPGPAYVRQPAMPEDAGASAPAATSMVGTITQQLFGSHALWLQVVASVIAAVLAFLLLWLALSLVLRLLNSGGSKGASIASSAFGLLGVFVVCVIIFNPPRAIRWVHEIGGVFTESAGGTGMTGSGMAAMPTDPCSMHYCEASFDSSSNAASEVGVPPHMLVCYGDNLSRTDRVAVAVWQNGRYLGFLRDLEAKGSVPAYDQFVVGRKDPSLASYTYKFVPEASPIC